MRGATPATRGRGAYATEAEPAPAACAPATPTATNPTPPGGATHRRSVPSREGTAPEKAHATGPPPSTLCPQPKSSTRTFPVTGTSVGIAAATAPGSTYRNNSVYAVDAAAAPAPPSSRAPTAPGRRAGVTVSAAKRETKRVATGPSAPKRAATTLAASPSGNAAVAVMIAAEPPELDPSVTSMRAASASSAYVTVAPSARAAASARGDAAAAAVATRAPPGEAGSSHSMSADDTTVAGALATPSITHRAAPFCREKPEPVTATALGVPAVETRRGVTAATTPAGSPAASPNAEGPRAMTLVIDSRVIIGTALGARSLMPVSTHAGEGTPRDGLPAGVAHVAVARLRGENVSASAALPGSTADARVATVPKRHVTSPAPAPAPAPAPRKNVTDAPPVSGDANDVVASVPAADAATAVAASDSGAARRACHAADPWRPASSPYAAASAVVAATRAAPAPRARGASHVRIAEETNRAPASSVHAAVPGSAASAVSPPRVSPPPAKRNAHRDRSVNPDDFAAAVATTRLPPPASPARGATAATDAGSAYWKTAPLLVKSAAFMETSTSTKPFRPPPPPSRVATEARGGG